MRHTTTIPHKDLSSTIPEYNPQTRLGNWDISQKIKTLIVLHTMDGYLTGTDAWFSRPNTMASAHYGIGLNGEIHQYVGEEYTSYANGKYDINQTSITIEFEDNNDPNGVKRTPIQLAMGAALIRDVCKAWGIPIARTHIKGHKEVNPGKSCPANLPMDELVKMANVESKPVTPTLTDIDTNTARYLDEQLKARGYGNVEGMVRALFEAGDKYNKLLQPDPNGKPPVVVPQSEYLALSIKAANLDIVASSLGMDPNSGTDPTFGNRLVGTIKGLSNGSSTVPDLGSGSNMPTEQDISGLQKILNFFTKKR